MVTKKQKKTKFIIGIDEAGRGALAGPVLVGAVMWKVEDWSKLKKELRDYPVGKDSKKLTPKQRDFWFLRIKGLKKKGLLNFAQAFSSNKVIDKKGINFAIREGIKKTLDSCEVAFRPARNALQSKTGGAHLKNDFSLAQSKVLLDGGLKASDNWPNQETIIKGDEKELIISLASIVAKVSRDREMVKLGKKYPEHQLERHKGYGTKLHYQKITEFGLLIIHRRTYLKFLYFKS